MVFERALFLWLVMLSACANEQRFPLRPVMWRDDDRTAFAPAPAEYISPFAWDGADQMVFRPVARFFAVDPAGRATNVNALDEVPDSSWFENRIGQHAFTPADIVSGPCGADVLDVNMPPGSWVIDHGKTNGANPGFRVNIPGVGKFLLKADPDGEPQRATGATAIAARLYHAAGYFAPCDSVVYFDPRILHLTPGLTASDNSGVARPFDQAALDSLLSHASHRAGLVRMGASRWLPGKPIGPARYEGTRDDDPNDVVPHEDRRELRGARLMAAWLNHFDSREQNTMDVFMPLADDSQHRLGHVRHYILDLGDCFGSVWASDELSRRLGHAYYFDFSYLMLDFVSFGAVSRPWERARRDGGIFNYFSARDFDPEDWRGGYPNPAFVRMTEADGAWFARILARFDDSLISAAVGVGQYDPPSAAYLVRTLIARRDLILQRYLTRLSPLADLRVRGHELCGVDLARRVNAVKKPSAPDARLLDADGPRALPLHWNERDELCVTLPPLAAKQPLAYGIVEIATGSSSQPLRAHVYDRGATGLWLAGIERD
ncbi:MAG TPA: hypothetical protein VFN67_20215 [Polyangiales bacterium]|nr:hypothetical protein [Polyangiales bacterium]